MKSYPEYKETDVEWVGKLPSHWKFMPLKYAALVNREALTEQVEEDFELQYIDIGNVNQLGLVNPPERMKFIDAPSRARRIIKKNDTIISTVRTYLKAVAFIDRDDDNLIASTGFATLTSLSGTHPKYLYYLVSNQGFVDTVSACSTGVSYPAITATELARIIAWLPPLPEQQAIADFLDRKTAQIDTLIEKKQRQIDLLQEQRTALINHAVTKGLNPNAPMKDSVVEWIGKIPSHWKTPKFKHIATVNGRIGWRGLTTQDYVDDGIILLGIRNISYRNSLLLNGITRIPLEKYNESPEIKVQVGDVLLAKTGATIGKSCVIKSLPEPMTVNAAINIFRVKDRVHPDYLNYLVTSNVLQEQIWLNVFENARGNIFQRDINELIGIRPPYEEQIAIADYIEQKSEEIFSLIDKVVNQIELIQEYRTALISEAVTGKIDVRTETIHE